MSGRRIAAMLQSKTLSGRGSPPAQPALPKLCGDAYTSVTACSNVRRGLRGYSVALSP
jgi:hypothetical protein